MQIENVDVNKCFGMISSEQTKLIEKLHEM